MSWIQTYSGRKVDPFKVVAADLDIVDIAHALSNICRFGGHSKVFYSVAQHCVLASEQVGGSLLDRKWALLHDAEEAYLGDIVRPLKAGFTDLWQAQKAIEAALARRFGLWAGPTESVKQVDDALLATEKRDVLAVDIPWDEPLPEPLGITIVPVGQAEAERMFMGRFAHLWGAASPPASASATVSAQPAAEAAGFNPWANHPSHAPMPHPGAPEL